MDTHCPFRFGPSEIFCDKHTRVARLPVAIKNKADLLTAYYENLDFPGYFGFNWDALSECLRDFHWIEERCVVVIHTELPSMEFEEMRIYVKLLCGCVNDWKPDENHELIVFFPETCEGIVREYLDD